MKKNFLSTPLVIATMAFAVVAFLFLIDTAINPDGSKKNTNIATNKNVTINTINENTNENSPTNENIVIRNGNFVTNENTNSTPIANTNEPFPVVNEDTVWEVKELFSEEFETPFGVGVITHVNCNETYCLAFSSSAGWVYKIVKLQGDSIETVFSFGREDLRKPYGARSAWNGQYWLITATTSLLKYDGKEVTELPLPDSNCTLEDIAWNGKEWMMVTYCNSVNPLGKIYSYNGTSFREISSDYPGVRRIAWNGSVWGFAGQRYSTSNPTINKALFLTYDGKSFKDYSDSFASLVENSVNGLIWNDKWEIAYLPNSYSSFVPILYSFDGTTLTNISPSLIGFEKAQTGFLINSKMYAVGAYKMPVLNVRYQGKLLDLSAKLKQYDVQSLAALNEYTLVVGSTDDTVLRITFIHE